MGPGLDGPAIAPRTAYALVHRPGGGLGDQFSAVGERLSEGPVRGGQPAAPAFSEWRKVGVGHLSVAHGSSVGTATACCSYKTAPKLYNTFMATVSVSEAREKLSAVIGTARSEAVVLERYGRPAAVVVSPERYEQFLEAIENAEDIAAFDAAMAEEGDNIPWDQVKADLGW